MTTLAQLVKELRTLQQAKKDIDDQIAITKADILEHISETTNVGDEKVIITRPNKVNYQEISRDFDPVSHPQLYEQKLSTAAVKEHFSPSVLAQYATLSDPQVKLA